MAVHFSGYLKLDRRQFPGKKDIRQELKIRYCHETLPCLSILKFSGKRGNKCSYLKWPLYLKGEVIMICVLLASPKFKLTQNFAESTTAVLSWPISVDNSCVGLLYRRFCSLNDKFSLRVFQCSAFRMDTYRTFLTIAIFNLMGVTSTVRALRCFNFWSTEFRIKFKII